MIKRYRKVSSIQAERFDGSNEQIKRYDIVPPQMDRDAMTSRGLSGTFGYQLPTKEGLMLFSEGDWIATGVFGEHWAIKNDVFERTYEPVGGK